MQFRELRVAISGASSFTAAWIARAFSVQGARVTALCPRASLANYDGLKRKRLEIMSSQVDVNYGVRAEDGSMAFWIEAHRPDIWIHHHHWMEAYRDTFYDTKKADAISLGPLKEIVRAIKKSSTKGIIFTGSYFEPNEGGSKNPHDSTPYGLSKQRTWDALKATAQEFDVPLSKIVVPNPIGPLENEDRLLPVLVQHARDRKPFHLSTADTVADNLPVKALGHQYLRAANDLLGKETKTYRPSGWVCTTKEMIDTANRELIMKRLNLNPCEIVSVQPQRPKRSFANIATERVDLDLPTFWDEYGEYLKTGTLPRDAKL